MQVSKEFLNELKTNKECALEKYVSKAVKMVTTVALNGDSSYSFHVNFDDMEVEVEFLDMIRGTFVGCDITQKNSWVTVRW